MLGRSVGLVAASALGGSAFLIPANVVPFGNDAAAIAPAVTNAKQSIVQLPCSECAFTKKQVGEAEDVDDVESTEDEVWAMGSANSIVVNLSISEDGQKLQVNGETIYPMDFQLESMLAQKIFVSQVASSASMEDIQNGKATTIALEVTGSGVSFQDAEVVTEEGHTIIPVKHSIFELERQPVSLEDIHIKLLKTVGGELFIAHVSTEGHHILPHPADFFAPTKWAKEMEEDWFSIMPHKGHEGPPHGVSSGPRECKNLPATLCKFKNMVEDRLMTMRQGHSNKGGFRKGGCHGGQGKGGRPFDGRLPAHIRPHFLRIGQDDDEAPRHHGRPHHMRPHGQNDAYRHHKHHFMHSFTHGLVAVLIPTMAGIAVGMVVSLVGLCLGRLISFLWIKLYRGGRRGYESVHLEENDEVVEDADIEKKSFGVLETSEPLPVYEEAPSYEEVQKEQK